MKTAVILTTYNRPNALAAVLAAYEEQLDGDFDTIIADDGSTEETSRLIERFRQRNILRIRHVWQDDRGFRAAAVRNKAIAATVADYLIFSDGDCIPLPDFVARHRRLAEKGWFVAGNRLLLNQAFTQRIVSKSEAFRRWNRRGLLTAYLGGGVNRWHPILLLPLGKSMRRRLTARRWQGVMTCNLAAWRDDLIAINGFDEAYEGWGLEDSDLAIRLLHVGLLHKSARFAAPVLHLWHGENDRGRLAENRHRLDDLLRSGRIHAISGLSQYLKNGQ